MSDAIALLVVIGVPCAVGAAFGYWVQVGLRRAHRERQAVEEQRRLRAEAESRFLAGLSAEEQQVWLLRKSLEQQRELAERQERAMRGIAALMIWNGWINREHDDHP